MNPKTQHYEGPAARMEGGMKLVVAFDGGRLLDLWYTGNPMWTCQLTCQYVHNVRVDYRLNAKGDKWLIQSLEVVEG